MLHYEKPQCRVRDLELETDLLTGSTEPYPFDPVNRLFSKSSSRTRQDGST